MQYFESPAFGEWCSRVYGIDMKQMGMVTNAELDLLYSEVSLSPRSAILDMGCGPGYITAAVAEHYESYATGIDINSEAIKHANTVFSGSPALGFHVADGNQITYNKEFFDLICFFDTLYFTQSVDKLRSLLDKCYDMLKPGGQLAIFWTNYPNKSFDIYDMSEPTVSNAQVAIWGHDNILQFHSVDLTESHMLFWYKAMTELKAMELELKADIPEHYKNLMDECAFFNGLREKGEAGGLLRWLFIFKKV